MCEFLSKSGGVPFQPLGDLTRNDPYMVPRNSTQLLNINCNKHYQYQISSGARASLVMTKHTSTLTTCFNVT